MAYNAKYGFDHKEDKSYEKVTAPLRKLLIKDAAYKWDATDDELKDVPSTTRPKAEDAPGNRCLHMRDRRLHLPGR